MKIILACLSVVFCVGASTWQAHAQSIVEQKKAVTFVFSTIHATDSSNKPLSVYAALGTAFFVFYPDQRLGPTAGFVYLVTAKHVLKDNDRTYLKEISIRLNLKDQTAEKGCDFIEHIPVADPNDAKKLTWLHYQDEAVDVAAIALAPNEDKFDFRTIPLSMFEDDETLRSDLVAEGDSAYFVGLMAQYYGEKRNYPVVRRGALALMTDEVMPTPTGLQRAFVAELASWPGNSGSPVFLNLNGLREGKGGTMTIGAGHFGFLGILEGTFIDVEHGTAQESGLVEWGNKLPTGISFIVPAERLKGLLNSPAAQEQRDAAVHQSTAPN